MGIVKAKGFYNEANKEILKELKKFFKAEIEIVSGNKSKEKVVRISKDPSQVKTLIDENKNTNYF